LAAVLLCNAAKLLGYLLDLPPSDRPTYERWRRSRLKIKQ
jgi:hypothetical protein